MLKEIHKVLCSAETRNKTGNFLWVSIYQQLVFFLLFSVKTKKSQTNLEKNRCRDGKKYNHSYIRFNEEVKL